MDQQHILGCSMWGARFREQKRTATHGRCISLGLGFRAFGFCKHFPSGRTGTRRTHV